MQRGFTEGGKEGKKEGRHAGNIRVSQGFEWKRQEIGNPKGDYLIIIIISTKRKA